MLSPRNDEPRQPERRSTELLPLAAGPPLSFDDRLRGLLRAAAELAGAAGGVIWLAESDGDDPIARACIGTSVEGAPESQWLLGAGPVGVAAREGRPVLIPDAWGGGSVLERQFRERGARALLALPLFARGRPVGAVHLEFPDPMTVDRLDRDRLAQLADHLGAVVEAAWLRQESEARHAELERKNAELRDLDRLKGDFLSMVSHELRTPLTAIIGYTDLLLREVHGPLNARQQQHQQAVKKAAHRLLGLINDVLDVTRLESGHVELAVRPVSLASAFERAVGELQAAAGQRQIELRLDVPTVLPVVVADPERLNQVLVNLLDNAIKFTPPEGTVTLRAERRTDGVQICVADTGAGVPAEQLGRIWDRFHQVDSSTRRRHGGTGLGLAIVRNLVQLHVGSVSAHSDGPGQGSTFCFTLPTSQAAVDPVAPAGEPAQPAAPGRRRSVLIVDDEPDNREIIASVVGDLLGHRALLAEDGEQALEQARRQPDLILLDLRLPGMSGFDVARELKADPVTAAIPVVAITALADRDDREAALAAGCAGCVTKPFTPAALTAAIVEALNPGGVAAGGARG